MAPVAALTVPAFSPRAPPIELAKELPVAAVVAPVAPAVVAPVAPAAPPPAVPNIAPAASCPTP